MHIPRTLPKSCCGCKNIPFDRVVIFDGFSSFYNWFLWLFRKIEFSMQ